MASKDRVAEVLDTCVWQDLVDTNPALLLKLMDLSRLRVAIFGVPDLVRQEFSCNADGIDKKRAGWEEQLDALARLAASLDFEAARSGRNYKNRGSSVCFHDVLKQMISEKGGRSLPRQGQRPPSRHRSRAARHRHLVRSSIPRHGPSVENDEELRQAA